MTKNSNLHAADGVVNAWTHEQRSSITTQERSFEWRLALRTTRWTISRRPQLNTALRPQIGGGVRRLTEWRPTTMANDNLQMTVTCRPRRHRAR
ncbi:unnamed protein product, partial [Citrullus colocynthis]